MTIIMNNDGKQVDNLDALFNTVRSDEAYLPDDGFTDNVMASLPVAKTTGLASWKKNTLILSATTIGSVTAALTVPAFSLPLGELIAAVSSIELSPYTLLAITAGIFGFSGVAIWANNKELI